jgi:hypothetical protein
MTGPRSHEPRTAAEVCCYLLMSALAMAIVAVAAVVVKVLFGGAP